MKKIGIGALIIVALLSIVYFQKPISTLAAYLWDSHAIIGGMYGSVGLPIKVDSEGKVYVNMSEMALIYTGVSRGGVSTIVSTVSKLSSTNLAFSILKLSGASKTFSIAAGSDAGQQITLVKSEHDARTLKLSLNIDNPNTAHTGFTSVTWPTAAGSFVTLTWIDDTIGWIITGQNGVTISY